ncbi:TVP38/TMEM64 family protein [Clostridium sp. cel8]|jgi:uncharacterized membrane protein YdjX (TVP38/TMEM64 family)|nr:TVP38/TMEM64 family protein [Clostridium sp. cel8]
MNINLLYKRILCFLKKYKVYIFWGIILILFIIFSYEYYYKYTYIIRNPRKIKSIIISYGRYSIFVFFMLQMFQVIVFFIPGELIQVAGGYIYGPFIGSILSVIGITTGSIIAYVVSKIFGNPLVNKMLSKKKLKFFRKILNLGSINFVVFLLYLIPGIPKDILAYICGISKISLKDFIIYSTLGRLPGIFISSYFGSKVYSEDKFILIFIFIFMVLLFVIGVFRGEKIVLKFIKNKFHN